MVDTSVVQRKINFAQIITGRTIVCPSDDVRSAPARACLCLTHPSPSNRAMAITSNSVKSDCRSTKNDKKRLSEATIVATRIGYIN